MASYYFSPLGNSQLLSTSGAPLSGGTVTTFQAGTSTPQATYADNAGGTPSTSLTLNTYGLPTSPVWLLGGQAYKFVIKDSLGNTIRTVDNVTGIPLATGELIAVRVITANGTYTPTSGTNSIIVEAVGGGGAGGGSQVTGGATVSAGGGGAGGDYGKGRFTSSFSSVSVTIGAGGTAAAGAVGGNGGNTSFGALLTANGGVGGATLAATAGPAIAAGGSGTGTVTGANICSSQGGTGGNGVVLSSTVFVSGSGGSSLLGIGANNNIVATPIGYGAGGAGRAAGVSSGAAAGSNGAAGVVIVYEYA